MMNNFLTLNSFTPSLSSNNETIMYILSFLKPGMPEAPHFSNVNIIKFLHYFQHLDKKHDMNNNNLIKILLNYYK